MRFCQWRVLVIALAVLILGAAGSAHAQCGPMDVVFVVDTTGSMGGVLSNVTAELPTIIDAIESASGGDFQLGLIEFKDDVIVIADLAKGNTTAVEAGIRALDASGGSSEPEASDEAIKTAVNNLKAADRPAGKQTGDFAGIWRPEADKIVIMITDARPAGFDDEYTAGVDDVAAAAIASAAALKDIHISAIYVPTFTTNEEIIVPIMQAYASVSGGIYLKTAEDGSGSAAAITEIIAKCGGAGSAAGSVFLTLDPTLVSLPNNASAPVKIVYYRPGKLDTLIYSAVGLPPDSTITFQPQTPELTGTDQRQMLITIGPATPPGLYIVYVTATHPEEGSIADTNYVLVVVECTPPGLLGTGQLVSQNVARGSTATLSVSPIGSGTFQYQWYAGFTGMTGSPVSGATSATFTTPAVNAFSSYWVRITNTCGSFDSNTAFLIPQ